MMQDFLETNRVELIARCRAKAARRIAPRPTPSELEFGIPMFLKQLIETFRAEQTPDALARHKTSGGLRPTLALVPAEIASTAAKHGDELLQHGFTVDQVVHDYGDLCQAMTELAMEKEVSISVDEFHTFNRCLDDAIADAVVGFSRKGSDAPEETAGRYSGEPLEFLNNEVRNLLDSAITSYAAIKAGSVGLQGSTSALHEATLVALRNLIGSAPVDATAANDGHAQ